MCRLKYVLIGLLLISLVAGPSCALFRDDNNGPNASSGPIHPGWEPVYVDEEAGVLLSTTDLVEKVAPTVVSIITEKVSRDIFFQPVPQTGAGSGVIVDAKGYVVTNNHVVEGANSVEVTLSDGRSFKAIKWATDPYTDLAVVEIDPGEEDLPFAHFLMGSLDKLAELEDVVAVGNALALPGGPTWTKGVVSYLGRSIRLPDGTVLEDLIQTDAAINPGNSGGPLFNMMGQVVGINVAIAAEAENIGFAISTNTAIPVVYDLIREESIAVAWLGVYIYTVTPAVKSQYNLSVDSGAFLVDVVSDSPAEDAGLQENDVITELDGEPITTADELGDAIRAHDPGDKVRIVFWRGSEEMEAEATLIQRPSL